MHVFPNPASIAITINLQQHIPPQNTTLSIFSITGQLLLQQPLTNTKTEINISQLAKGIYILKLNSDDKVAVGRFVKE
ncbi:MAG: hypothetical protein BWY70_00455 [Bacteroidetes bacterium ADurb.Bin408]|nr:MAG: hypothetical protein BWY70_00455 [Bacteroidetes bacterium ADurb.Bin408]